jgi:hypothetical protein
MADLKIRIYKNNQSDPETTVTIPGRVLTVASKLIPKVASKLIPKRATEAMQEKGIDIDEIIELSKKPDINGTIIEVEEHIKKEKIIVALE